MVRELFSSESFRGLNERKPNHKLSLRRRHGLGENLSSTEQVKQQKNFFYLSSCALNITTAVMNR